MKLNIDITYDDNPSNRVPLLVLKQVVEGCHETLKLLGEQSKMVDAIRVTWLKFDEDFGFGPNIMFHLVPLAGFEYRHSADFRFMGDKTPTPSAKAIAEYFCQPSCLPRFISEHTEKCRSALMSKLSTLPSVRDVSSARISRSPNNMI